MALAEFPRHRFTADEYHRMGDLGLLHPDLRVELIEGEIVDMAPTGPDHVGTLNYLTAALAGPLGRRAVVQVQGPLLLSASSEPEPDLLVLRPRDDFYRGRLAEPRDVLLAIEVAKSSFRFDHDVKLPLYASVAVPETWIVDLIEQRIIVGTEPGPGGYASQRVAAPGDTLDVMGLAVEVADVLGVTCA